MQELLKFLSENPIFFIATADGDQPRVRPFGFAMDFEGKLCICTSNKKDVFKQMIANPKIEISACSKDGKWVRVCGKATAVPGDDAKRKALEIMPSLSAMYSVGDGIFEILSIDNATATFCSMSGEAPRTVTLS